MTVRMTDPSGGVAADVSGDAARESKPDGGLPDWLAEPEGYEPADDRSTFIERNLGSIGAMLAAVADGGQPELVAGPVDRLLGHVSTSLRLLGLVLAIVCVNATRNMAFGYVMLAVVLAVLAIRPARLMRTVVFTGLGIAALSSLIALPAVFLGQYSSPMRLFIKAFITVSLTVGLARTVPWNRLIAGLRGLRVPNSVVYICDVTIQFIDILGRSMLALLDSLSLRSVGRDRHKMASAGHVLGAVFLLANRRAREMSEAMLCRGFAGEYRVPRQRWLTAANAAYLVMIAGMCAMAVYFG
ncbi:energy-coupling factor transporter transmembrane component T [Bifidobacterium vansinderenii]|uniref:Cobalt ABC transporter permease n=1 Tax=Bifidobacterium vansinderenii TaxID=1984871 RepID=A0A229VVM4_9BIFI|nr:energy-coupling factor transporter transmembrane component T [Bifidobacterium vansinderenii]OXM99666.1 cobalt ABC transporter permease [Bifidobacterium vansinderenii]